MSQQETRGFVQSIMAAKSIWELGATFGAIEHGKKTKRLTAKEFSSLCNLGMKKEALLHAQGYR